MSSQVWLRNASPKKQPTIAIIWPFLQKPQKQTIHHRITVPVMFRNQIKNPSLRFMFRLCVPSSLPSCLHYFRRRHREIPHLIITKQTDRINVPRTGLRSVSDISFRALFASFIRHRWIAPPACPDIFAIADCLPCVCWVYWKWK